MHLIAPVAAALSSGAAERADPGEEFAAALTALAPIGELSIGAGSHELLQLIPPVIAAFSAVANRPDWSSAVRAPHGEDFGLDPWPVAVLHVARAAMAQNRGDVAELGAESLIAVAQFDELGDRWGLALSKQMRAEWLIVNGRLDEALIMSDESTASLREVTSSFDLAQQQGQAISVLLRLGRMDEAAERAELLLAEAVESGNSRTLLQTHITTVMVDLQAQDLAAADKKLAVIDELLDAWPGVPGQQHAMAAAAKAGADVLRGDLASAESHLRSAAEAAFASHDQPVIGHVAIGIGALALARGDIPKALKAVDLSTVLIGAYDGSNPHVVSIEKAARDAGIGRAGAEALTRPKALEALKQLALD